MRKRLNKNIQPNTFTIKTLKLTTIIRAAITTKVIMITKAIMAKAIMTKDIMITKIITTIRTIKDIMKIKVIKTFQRIIADVRMD